MCKSEVMCIRKRWCFVFIIGHLIGLRLFDWFKGCFIDVIDTEKETVG